MLVNMLLLLDTVAILLKTHCIVMVSLHQMLKVFDECFLCEFLLVIQLLEILRCVLHRPVTIQRVMDVAFSLHITILKLMQNI